MKPHLIIAISLFSLPTWAQVTVNPDGTHSTICGAGKGSIIVGPDGSHTILQNSAAIDTWRTRSRQNRKDKNKSQNRPQ